MIITLVAWGFWSVFVAGPASCFDGRQNQGEDGVDCGGPCVSCDIKNVRDIQIRSVHVVRAGDVVGTAVEIYNPNTQWAARSFTYRVTLINEVGETLATIAQEGFVYAGQLTYLVIPRIEQNLSGVVSARASISEVIWESIDRMPTPNIEAQSVRTVLDDGISVTGVLANHGESGFSNVLVNALLFNRQGTLIAVSRTTVDSLPRFESESFAVHFAKDLDVQNVQLDVNSFFPRTLSVGDQGQDVGTLQSLLAELGILSRQPTNYFDEFTSQGVAQLQSVLGIESTGVFDENTRQAIVLLLGAYVQNIPQQDPEKTVDPTRTKVFIEANR